MNSNGFRSRELGWFARRHVTHYALGSGPDSPCGYYSLWHRGLAYTRDREAVTCSKCRRWLGRQAHVTA